MSKIDDGMLAFPIPATAYPDGGIDHREPGMTLRQYAAIHLRVPNSGDDWLDDMIAKARRVDAAEKAMQGLLAGVDDPHLDSVATIARRQAGLLHG